MVSVLPSSAVDREFEHDRVKPDFKIGICCFSAKQACAALRRKSKDLLDRYQDNVS